MGFFRFGTVPVHGVGEDAVDNIFLSLLRGDGFPAVDLGTIGLLAAFAAIAGQGGLTNTPLSNYTRDQGWGMGYHVGAIPSVIGGRNISLSHVGTVFDVTSESLPRRRRWYRHVMRDQLFVWMPACFIGLALPSMLSVQFLARGTRADEWAAAGMTADGVRSHVSSSSWGPSVGTAFWYMTLFCGFLGARAVDGLDDRRHRAPLGRRFLDLECPTAPMGNSPDSQSVFLRALWLLGVRTVDVVLGQARAAVDRGQQHLELRAWDSVASTCWWLTARCCLARCDRIGSCACRSPWRDCSSCAGRRASPEDRRCACNLAPHAFEPRVPAISPTALHVPIVESNSCSSEDSLVSRAKPVSLVRA